MPDWAHILNNHQLDHPDNLDNLTELDRLRCEAPLVWMILIGVTRSRDMAARLGWPHDYVMIELRRLKKESVVWDEQGARSMLWRIHPSEIDLLRLDAWRRSSVGTPFWGYPTESSQPDEE